MHSDLRLDQSVHSDLVPGRREGRRASSEHFDCKREVGGRGAYFGLWLVHMSQLEDVNNKVAKISHAKKHMAKVCLVSGA